jgi:hypothetical protein
MNKIALQSVSSNNPGCWKWKGRQVQLAAPHQPEVPYHVMCNSSGIPLTFTYFFPSSITNSTLEQASFSRSQWHGDWIICMGNGRSTQAFHPLAGHVFQPLLCNCWDLKVRTLCTPRSYDLLDQVSFWTISGLSTSAQRAKLEMQKVQTYTFATWCLPISPFPTSPFPISPR